MRIARSGVAGDTRALSEEDKEPVDDGEFDGFMPRLEKDSNWFGPV
jgi:hypothetical protein